MRDIASVDWIEVFSKSEKKDKDKGYSSGRFFSGSMFACYRLVWDHGRERWVCRGVVRLRGGGNGACVGVFVVGDVDWGFALFRAFKLQASGRKGGGVMVRVFPPP